MQMVAGGAILASLLPDIFTLQTGMLASAVIFGAVAIIGGLWSAALSNVVNVIVIIAGLVIGVIAVVNHFGGMDVYKSGSSRRNVRRRFTLV
jgi:SSS family solute:Na+ symporter